MLNEIHPIPDPIATNSFVTEAEYRTLYARSLEKPEEFWAEQAQKFIHWFSPCEKVLQGGFDKVDVRWFQGGKLNATYNCLDRHLQSRANQTAIIWESDDPNVSISLTYGELYERVGYFANVLKYKGVKKGDRVCIYLTMIPEAAIAILACARIGAIHSVVFGGFSAEALKTRIEDAGCAIVITANEGIRGNKIIPLKQNVDLALHNNETVHTVIVIKRTESGNQTDGMLAWNDQRDVWYDDCVHKVDSDCPATIMDAEDPLFILYTSGSTGKPKGILHGTGGYLVYAAMTYLYIFDYHPAEVYWCTADVGWITGHTYGIYGPLLNGATTLLFEGMPTYPTPSRFWEVIDKHKVNIFYTAPTAIRALRREGDHWVKKTDRKSLRLLGTVGEPINPDAWKWYYSVVGDSRCPIVDTWWQTETGGIMISPFPGATPLKPGSAAWPFFGVSAEVVDDTGTQVTAGKMGKLVITQPWPGMLQTIYRDRERFVNAYFNQFPGKYLTGDQAYRDQEGYFWILGRSDDVIKVSGHRISTQEVESALMVHPDVAETAVIGVPNEIKGQSIFAYVTLKAGKKPSDKLKDELKQEVRKRIGAIAIPEQIEWIEALPKTRSGKIMRRLLRKIANNEIDELGDLSTLADANIIEQLIAGAKSRNQQ